MEIPKEIKEIIRIIESNKFEAYIVGGCVRDFLRKKNPQDWDVATNARPEQIQKIFEKKGFDVFCENKFGTVGIVLPEDKDRNYYNIVEITTYRTEAKYINKRHPSEVKWAKSIEEDLARRDFTVNAMAMKVDDKEIEIIDPFGGQADLSAKIIKAVGDPNIRFFEDSLRMMRGVRLATTLNFRIEDITKESIQENALWIKEISQERIRDEFLKIIMCPRAADGIELLRTLGLLGIILPELDEGCGVAQNKHHIHDCYKHNLLSLDYATKNDFSMHVRIAALLHDVAKPRVKEGEGSESTFYNHEIVGAKMTQKILERLKFSRKDIVKIVKLVRYHLFYYNVGEVSESSIRRLVRQVGIENIDELLQVRMCDRIGSGVPKAEPYKLRHLRYLIDKVSQDPISVKMLKIGGNDLMKSLDIKPGPRIGWILNIILSYVLLDPLNNNKDFLEAEARRLNSLSDKELGLLNIHAKEELDGIETKRDETVKKKYWVT